VRCRTDKINAALNDYLPLFIISKMRRNIMQADENRIREYAYQIWESEGKPDGRAEQHWKLACEWLESEYPENEHQDSHSNQSNTFIPHQNNKVGKHAHHPNQPH
jgi:hypothetical protein